MKTKQSAQSANGAAHRNRENNLAAGQRIWNAALMSLAVTVAAGSFSSSQMLRLVFGLQHPHIADEEQFLVDLQTVGSPEFRHFLTADEWNARFSPSPQDEQALVDWAQSQGFTVTNRFANRLRVDVEAPVSVIEAALGVKIDSYAIGVRRYYSNDRNPAAPAALGNIVHSAGGLNNIQVMKFGNREYAQPEFPVYSPGLSYFVGVSGSDAGDRTKLAGDPGLTDGVYDPTALYNSRAYDTRTVNALTNLATFVAFSGSFAPGTWPIQAVYGGNLNFNTSTSPVLEQVVNV
jgi:subtilase family serine protease